MRVNPLVDFFAFLTGPIYGKPFFMVILYWIVALASLAVAVVAALKLPAQRDAAHIGRFLTRFILGSMWCLEI